MAAELFFIYDTHCPWSYATTPLVNAIEKAFPTISINLFHCAHYQGDECISEDLLETVTQTSNITFTPAYLAQLSSAKDSTLTANLMAWTSRKAPNLALPLLNAIQQAHFDQANALTCKADLEQIIGALKLSPPAKVFTKEKFVNDAQISLQQLEEFQAIIGTSAIPALLLAIDDQLIMLNHNFYLTTPEAIVEAVTLEMAKAET
jgi:putative protein-disulfide isomerase